MSKPVTDQQKHAHLRLLTLSSMNGNSSKILTALDTVRSLEAAHKVAPGSYGSLALLDLVAALTVLTDPASPGTAHLEKVDPKGLEQARKALQS